LAWLARRPLAWFIAHRRAAKVAEHYREIGGGSPLRLLTERQSRALEEALRPEADARVVVAMRYWHPDTSEARRALEGFKLDQLILLPLSPQYSFATTRSSLREWSRQYRNTGPPPRTIEHFHDHPDYIAAIVEKVQLSLTHFDRPDEVQLVFSAHGLPLSLIERGDPYQKQVEATVGLVRERGGWPNPHCLCYQSKVGRQKWLEPSLVDAVERLARGGCTHMLVIPISFVSEHVETLHEINIEARAEATKLGVRQFEMMPALNDSPRFIAALADLVLRAAGMR
jgi:ferrochelatase